MRNLALTFFVLFSLIFLACEKPTSEVEVEAASSRLDTIAAVVMNDSMWRADSIQMWDLWGQFWFYDDNDRNDSAIIICKRMIEMGQPMMEFRFDSTIFEKYAKAFGGIGYNLLMKRQLEDGFTLIKKSYDLITEKFGENQPRNSELCTGFTIYYQLKGDYDQALYYCDKSLKIRRNSIPGLHYYEGNVYGNYAVVYVEMGMFDKAIEYLQKALENYRLTNPYAMAHAHSFLSYAYLQNKDYSQAIVHARECIRLATEDQPWKKKGFIRFPTGKKQIEWHYFDLPNVYVLLGSAYREMGLLDTSVEQFKKAIDLGLVQWEKSGDIVATAWLELGKTYAKMNEPALAKDAFKQVEPILEKYSGKGKSNIADAWRETGHLQLESEEPDSAVFYFQKALQVTSQAFSLKDFFQNAPADSLTPSLLLLDLLEEKACALVLSFQKSDKQEALLSSLKTFGLASSLTESMRHSLKWQDSKQNLSKRAQSIFEGAVETSLAMHQLTGDVENEELAFTFAERSKAFTLLENLQSERAKSFSGISSDLLEREEKINQEIALYQRFILEEKQNSLHPNAEKLAFWQNTLLDLKKSQDSLLTIFEKNYPEYYRLKYENPIATTAQIQRKLKANETLIEYFLGDSTLYTFTVNKTGLNYHQQKIDSTFFQTIDQLRHFANTPNQGAAWTTDYRQYVADTRYLYQTLLEPALDTTSSLTPHPFPNDRDRLSLIIIPDGILGYLPFNLLLTKEPDPAVVADYSYRGLPYLVSNYDIRYEYSATLMLESQKMRSKVRNWLPWHNEPAYCGFAPTYGDGEAIAKRGEEDSLKLSELFTGLVRGKLGALRFNRPEIEEASAAMEGKVFEAEAATEAEFKRQASQANILHLAMHALTNDREPLFSQLVFTQDDGDTTEDGRLHAYELQNMKLKADLAVLSACNTGAGKLQRGEGVMSLSRAFKFAGVPNVVMSLWQADDLSTKTIVGDFFRHLKAGMRKDKALCEAQRNFIKNIEDQRLTHPFYWSTFMLVGDGEPVFFNGIMRASAILWLAVLSLLIATAWFFRKKI